MFLSSSVRRPSKEMFLKICRFLLPILLVPSAFAQGFDRCQSAPHVTNSDRSSWCSGGSPGTTCTYTCRSGYKRQGPGFLVCTAVSFSQAQWTGGRTTCQPLKCPRAPDVLSSERSRECNGDVFQKICKYTCKRGYTLKGPGQLVCSTNGASAFWFGATTSCDRTTCDSRAPEVSNSKRSPDCEGRTDFDKTCTYTCKDNFHMIGKSNIKCGENGRWIGDPPECKETICLSAPRVSHSRLSRECLGASVGEKCTYNCDYGYKLEGQGVLTCTAQKTWQGTPPTCKEITCPATPNVADSTRSSDCNGGKFERTCNYECNRGFKAIGSTHLTCKENGEWNNRPPTCREINCPKAPEVNNSIRSPECDDGKLEQRCTYFCQDGFVQVVGSPLLCMETEKWDGELPVCKEAACPELPHVPFSSRSRNCVVASVNDLCGYNCYRGYRIQGKAILTCTDRKQWDGQPPKCTKIICPRAPDIKDGSRSDQCNNAEVGYRCSYQCNEGFLTQGDSVLTCNDQGEWDKKPPVCREIGCPDAPSVPRSRMSGSCSSVSVGDVCTYECDEDFRMQGNSMLTCTQQKEWSSSPPDCTDAANGVSPFWVTSLLTLAVCVRLKW